MVGWKAILGPSKTHAAFIVAAIAFAISQSLLVGHAAQYGDEHHEHGGQACVLSLAAPTAEKLLTAAAFVFVGVIIVWRFAETAEQTEPARMSVGAARPRGPPHR